MKSLQTLIRLRKRELDRLRRDMARQEDKRDQQVARIEKLNDDLMAELQAAGELTEMRGFFGDFSDSIRKRQKIIAIEVLRIEQKIQEMAVEVANQYADLKKFEISYERYLEREAQKAAKKEQEELDEIGIRKHHYGDAHV